MARRVKAADFVLSDIERSTLRSPSVNVRGGGGGGGGGGVGGCETVVDGPPETPWWGEVGAPLTPVLAGAVKGGNVYMPRQSAP
ncbi:hypothetical protein V1477_000762 [Vespula maculifrons]|uniref:Uncharacterized protein n=1 Tax=Vespula maculifrons TaxID=7453 RepID=A0ABD2D176_VESMC